MKQMWLAVVVAAVIALAGRALAQTTLFIATDPPQTYCAVNGSTATLSTTWWDGQQMTAHDSLTLPRVNGNNWQCTGNYTASVSWTDPNLGSCQGIAIAANDIPVSCNGNACTPTDKTLDYTIQWSNPSCAN
jgi:hypothetical protein